MREISFQINGARLFNSLPSNIRNIKRDLGEFKEALDRYLGTIPEAVQQPAGLDPHNIVYKVGLGCFNRTPRPP